MGKAEQDAVPSEGLEEEGAPRERRSPREVLESPSETLKDLWGTRWGRIGLPLGGFFVLWPLMALLMPDGAPVPVVLQGIVFGTVTGLLALGLVLTYRTNRIINFAYASMGGVGGVLAVHLFTEAGWNYGLAIAAGLITGLVVGGLVDVLVIRRFANSSRLIVTVATIGLAQILGGLELAIPGWFDATGFVGGFETPLSDATLNIPPVLFNGDHLLILLAVPPIIAFLAWFLLRTDAGVAVRAAAENRDRAILLGIPIKRLITMVWIVAGGLAALTSILKAPFAGSVSTAFSGPTLLLPAIAAAVVAGMYNLPLAFVGGIGLGVVEQVVFWNTQRASTIDVSFLVVILLGLLLQRRTISRAEESGEGTWSMAESVRRVPIELRRLPEVRAVKWGGLAVLAGLALWLPTIASVGDKILMSTALIFGMVAVSLVLLAGWGGNISLGQFAIAGVGAVVAGNLAVRWNVDLFITLAVAGAAGAVTALLIGVPALRIQGLFLAATTLAFAVALDSFFLNPNNLPEIVVDGAGRPILWERWPLNDELTFYYLTLGFLLLSALVTYAVRQARSGRALIATKDNRRAAAAAAVPTTATKLSGFALSGVIAGVAGGLYVFLIGGVGSGTFLPSMSLEVFSTAVIGGLSSVGGALLGVFSFRLLEQLLSGQLRLIVTGTGLLVVLMVIPGGMIQPIMKLRDRALRWLADRKDIHVPSLLEDRRIEDGTDAEEDRPPDETAILSGALDTEDSPRREAKR